MFNKLSSDTTYSRKHNLGIAMFSPSGYTDWAQILLTPPFDRAFLEG